MPLISVIIPCYNYSAFIVETIDSVIAQLHAGDELIVVDDGSTDDTRDRLDPYIEEGGVQYIYQDNTGVSAARNRGAEVASGDYLYFIDADDAVLDGGLDLLRHEAESHADCAMVFAGHVSIDEAGNERAHRQKSISTDGKRNFIDYTIRKRFSIANGGAVLIKREIALAYPYPETLKVSEDFCVYAWVLANHVCHAFPDSVVAVRKHAASLRNQLSLYESAVEQLPDILFESGKLPDPLRVYKKPFICNRLLSLFRAQFLSGEVTVSRKTYLAAVRCNPLNVFKWSYLKKYLKACL